MAHSVEHSAFRKKNILPQCICNNEKGTDVAFFRGPLKKVFFYKNLVSSCKISQNLWLKISPTKIATPRWQPAIKKIM